MRTQPNLIGGTWRPAEKGATFRTFNPADHRECVAEYAQGGREDAIAAVAAAQAAARGWAGETPVARGRILSKASHILESRKRELSELLTREEGKTIAESTGEVQRAIDIFRFHGGLSYAIGGRTIPADLPGNLLYTVRQPLGVVALITPWNFPIAIPAWKLAPALLGGNAVVLKPSSLAPAMAFELARALQEAGLPPGVCNVVTGEGRPVGGVLAEHPAVAAVSFTGSYGVGQSIHQQLAPRMARSQMEMGGKNPTIVLADADLDLAATLVARAGFGLTGQACTATSRVIVDRRVSADFTAKLVAKAQAIKVGAGLDAATGMGPAVSEDQLLGNLGWIKTAVSEGAEILSGGRRLDQGALVRGWFMEPTVLGNVHRSSRIASEEVFGPVVAVMPADDFDDALDVANSLGVGLSASLVTRDFKAALRYTERIEAGVVKVNQVSTGLALQAPFGGVKRSSTDSFKEQGSESLDFYTRTKTVYLDYSA